MFIEQTKYDKLPLAIQIGALELWGTKITSYESYSRPCDLFQFNDFFAEVCYDTEGKACSVKTFPDNHSVESPKPFSAN